jgi:phage gp29-like protein
MKIQNVIIPQIYSSASNSVSFTPSGYRAAANALKSGSFSPLIAMLKETESDGFVYGCLQARDGAIDRAWDLRPFSQDKADRERAEWLWSVFDNLGVNDLVTSVANAILYIYQVVDFKWELVDGKWTPTEMIHLGQQYFRYSNDVPPILRIDQGKDGAEIPETALIAEINRDKRTPVMLSVLKNYILLNFGEQSWASFLENFGEGIILGKYPDGADDKTRNETQTAVDAIAASSRGIMPESSALEVVESKRGTGDHKDFKWAFEEEISIALLGHSDGVRKSQTQIGANDEAFKVGNRVANSIMSFAEKHINRWLRVLWKLNFGDRRYPIFELSKYAEFDSKDWRESLRLLYDMGVPVVRSNLEKLGVDLPEDFVMTQNPLQMTGE